jgi:hypothetical protein
MQRFWVVLVLAAIGCGPTKEEANQAASDALVTLGKLRAARQSVVEMKQRELARFDPQIAAIVEKIKAGREEGKQDLFAVIRERDAVIEKWAADLDRRDAVILRQKAIAEEAAMVAGPEVYGETPNLADDAIAKEAPQPNSDTVEIP